MSGKRWYHTGRITTDDPVWSCDCKQQSRRWKWSWVSRCRVCGVERSPDRIAPSTSSEPRA